MSGSAVTTHVLDTALGRPAAGVPVRFERVSDDAVTDPGRATVLATAATDEDGRVSRLGPTTLDAGTYRLTFDTAAYASASGQACFFPEVVLTFALPDGAAAEDPAAGPGGGRHFHVPLLLSPYGYSTYRGS